MTLQYVSLRIGGRGRLYTYEVDHGDPIQPGSQVEITTPLGTTRLDTVEAVSLVKPAYPTKRAKKV